MKYWDRQAEFEREPAAEEVWPLLLIRRAITRLEMAYHDSLCAAEAARSMPTDDRLARTAEQARRDVATLAEVAGRAVLAWSGQEGPVLLDYERGRYRADPGQGGAAPRFGFVEPDGTLYHGPGVVLDLAEAERDFVRRSLAGVLTDEAHLARALAIVAKWSNGEDREGGDAGRVSGHRLNPRSDRLLAGQLHRAVPFMRPGNRRRFDRSTADRTRGCLDRGHPLRLRAFGPING